MLIVSRFGVDVVRRPLISGDSRQKERRLLATMFWESYPQPKWPDHKLFTFPGPGERGRKLAEREKPSTLGCVFGRFEIFPPYWLSLVTSNTPALHRDRTVTSVPARGGLMVNDRCLGELVTCFRAVERRPTCVIRRAESPRCDASQSLHQLSSSFTFDPASCSNWQTQEEPEPFWNADPLEWMIPAVSPEVGAYMRIVHLADVVSSWSKTCQHAL